MGAQRRGRSGQADAGAGRRGALIGLLWLIGMPGAPAAGAPGPPPFRAAGPDTGQLVVVMSPAWGAATATLQRFARTGPGAFGPVGPPVAAMLGPAGLGWGRGLHPAGLAGPEKGEGDGRAPAGVFRLTRLFGLAARAPSRRGLPYTRIRPGHVCVDDPRSHLYNRIVDRQRLRGPVDFVAGETLVTFGELYRLLAVVAHNAEPEPLPGAGSCIFLHAVAGPGVATAGCTALAAPELQSLLAWLDRRSRPRLVQLPAPVYAEVRDAWGLPEMRAAPGAE